MVRLAPLAAVHAGNAEEATDLWESAGCALQPTFTGALMPYLGHSSEDIRGAAAEALAAGLEVRRASSKTPLLANDPAIGSPFCLKHTC